MVNTLSVVIREGAVWILVKVGGTPTGTCSARATRLCLEQGFPVLGVQLWERHEHGHRSWSREPEVRNEYVGPGLLRACNLGCDESGDIDWYA